MGRKGFYGKNKKVSLEKTDGFLEEQTGDKKVDENVCLSRCEWLSFFFVKHPRKGIDGTLGLSPGVRPAPKRKLMAASFVRSCCF